MKRNTLIMLCCFCISLLQAQKPDRKSVGGWHILGTSNVMYNMDHEGVTVKPSINVKKLKLTVRDQDLTITKIVVQYDSGEDDTLLEAIVIPKNGESGIVEIDSGVKNIKRIDFWYKSENFTKGRAEVTIFGRK